MPARSIDTVGVTHACVGATHASPLLVILIGVLATVPYLNALQADFVFDDAHLIRDNPAVQVLPAVDLFHYVHPAGGLYRPLTMLTYAANAALNPAPFAYHLVNLVLHALVSLGVFALARHLLESTTAATAAAALFAVHPIHTEVVTGIVGRAELLAALSVVAMLLAFARAQRTEGPARWLWSTSAVAAFAAGVLAKENAFTGLGLLIVLHWWIDRRATAVQRIAALTPYLAVAGAYLALRLAVLGTFGLSQPPTLLDNPLAHVDTATRLRTAVVVLGEYLEQLAVPLHLSADYSFNQIALAAGWGDPRFVLAAALLAAVAVAVTGTVRRAPQLALAAAFTAIPLALTANLLFPIGTIKAERLLYLPSLGWCLGCGWLAALAIEHKRSIGALALSAVVAAYAVRTWTRNGDWRSEDTLFAATLRDAPRSAKAHYNGAIVLQRAGQLDDAMVHYRRALEMYPAYGAAAYGIGHVYALKGIEVGALAWYEEAIRREPAFAQAHLQIALLHYARDRFDSAEAALVTGLEGEPHNPTLLVNLGAVHLAQGDAWRAGAALVRLDGIGMLDTREHALVTAARREIEVALR